MKLKYYLNNFILTICLLVGQMAYATIRYVNPAANGTGDGSSWANASGSLNDILLSSAAGDEVWVAAGTYVPTKDKDGNNSPTNARHKTYFIMDGVKLFGGFVGTESNINQRSISANETILSGDIGTTNVNTDNSYHVVLALNPTVSPIGITIDGFTIRDGNANGSGGFNDLNSCIVKDNNGAGLFVCNGTNFIKNNLFFNNSADVSGGGIYVNGGINTITDNSFTTNTTNNASTTNTYVGYGGGAMFLYNGNQTISGNTISLNKSNGVGGGIYTEFGSSLITKNQIFSNEITSGGTYGGGIFIGAGTDYSIIGNLIYSNKAYGGGGIYFRTSCTIVNNVFQANTVSSDGGAVFSNNAANVKIVNNTFQGNIANSGSTSMGRGGAIATANGNIQIKNNLFNSNTSQSTSGSQEFYNSRSGVTLSNNILQNASTDYGTATLVNNIHSNSNPYFVNDQSVLGVDNMPFTADDGLNILSNSPVLNAGVLDADSPSKDILGLNRKGNPDIGAYEPCILGDYPTNVVSCTPYTWAANGQTYRSSGVYSYQDPNADCAITEVLFLSILPPTITATLNTQASTSCDTKGTASLSNINAYTTITSNDFTVNVDFTASLSSSYNSTGGAVIQNGEMQLTAATNSQNGALVYTPTSIPQGFTALFDLNVYSLKATSGEIADGISFNFGELQSTPIGSENGMLSANNKGLVIRFKEYQTQTIEVVYNNVVKGTYAFDIHYPTIRKFRIAVSPDGKLSMAFGEKIICSNVDIGTAYITDSKNGWEFAWGARTGGANNRHAIDNIEIYDNAGINFSADDWATSTALPFFSLAQGMHTIKAGSSACSSTVGTANTTFDITQKVSVTRTINNCNQDFTIANTFASDTLVWADFASRPALANADNLGDATFEGGVAKLTPLGSNKNGRMIFDPKAAYGVFIAKFNAKVWNGSGADGIGFSYGTLGNPGGGDGGMINTNIPGLSIGFPSYGSTNNIIVKYKNNQITSVQNSATNGNRSEVFIPIEISVNETYKLTVKWNNTTVISNYDLAANTTYEEDAKTGWQFGFGARTGGADDEHFIDDVIITGKAGLLYSYNGGTNFETATSKNIIGNSASNIVVKVDGFCTKTYNFNSAGGIKYVNKSITTGNNDGTSWTNAYQTLNLALQQSCPGDSIWVAAGTYVPTTDYTGSTTPTDLRDRTFYVRDGQKIFGGFNGTETSFSQRNIKTNETILSGELGNVGSSDNAYHVLVASAPSVNGIGVTIDGFTIQDGNANVNQTYVTINGNSVYRIYGGGISLYHGFNNVENNIIKKNSGGTGLYQYLGSLHLKNNIIADNVCTGVLIVGSSSGEIISNIFSNNNAVTTGGALWISQATISIINNLFYNNSAGNKGGAIYTIDGSNSYINNTFFGNTCAANAGGAISTEYASTPFPSTHNFTNNIFWNNTGVSSISSDIFNVNPTNITHVLNNNLMQNPSNAYSLGGGIGNIFATNPKFVNIADTDGADNILGTADDGLSIFTNSPAANAGKADITTPLKDISGFTRTGVFDLGAYEGQVAQALSIPTNLFVSKDTVCLGSSVTLNATCAGGTATWYTTAASGSTIGSGASFIYTPNALFTYYASCKDGTNETARVLSGKVAIKAIPTLSITKNSPLCEGGTLTLLASGASSYSWSGPESFTSLISNPSRTNITPSQAGTYTLTGTENGCSVTASASVVVNPLPAIPTITADNMTICKGGSVIMTGNCTTAGAKFRWETPSFLGNQTQAAAQNTSVTRTITEPGTYRALCESTAGCLSAYVSITITQAINCSGQEFITITPEKPIVCPGKSILMTATGCAGTVTWTGGATSPTGATATLSPTANTIYTATCSTGGFQTFDILVATSTIAVASDVPTGKERFKAITTLTSNKRVGDTLVTPGANVIYEAGNSITLLPGFSAEKWSTFKAEIKICN